MGVKYINNEAETWKKSSLFHFSGECGKLLITTQKEDSYVSDMISADQRNNEPPDLGKLGGRIPCKTQGSHFFPLTKFPDFSLTFPVFFSFFPDFY